MLATVSGRVQGVGFRWHVQREAERLGVVGWVANRTDGHVEVVAEATEGVLAGLLMTLWEGPAGASVDDVRVLFEPARGNLVGFAIRSGEHPGD
jgi:acylphosphatase